MDDPSGVRGARTSLAIAFTLFTAVVALLWVLPKGGTGGALWLFTLPVALVFPYFSYQVIAPGNPQRTTSVTIFMIVSLIVMFLFGGAIASRALPDHNLSGSAAAMVTLTSKWRLYAPAALLIVGILKLIDRSRSARAARGTEPVPGLEESAPASGDASEHSPIGTLRPSSLVPLVPVRQPAQPPMRPTTASRPAAVPTPAPLEHPALHHTSQETSPEGSSAQPPAPSPRPVQKTATVHGVSFFELETLVEVATSLSDPGSPTSLLLRAAPEGLELAAGATELGTVTGSLRGTDTLRVRLSAQETAEALASFSPPPQTLSIRLRFDDVTAVEFRDDLSARHLVLSAVRG